MFLNERTQNIFLRICFITKIYNYHCYCFTFEFVYSFPMSEDLQLLKIIKSGQWQHNNIYCNQLKNIANEILGKFFATNRVQNSEMYILATFSIIFCRSVH